MLATADRDNSGLANSWLKVILTDAVRPESPMEKLRQVWPHTIALEFEPDVDLTSSTGLIPVSPVTDPADITADFYAHVTGSVPDDPTRTDRAGRRGDCSRSSDALMKINRLTLQAFALRGQAGHRFRGPDQRRIFLSSKDRRFGKSSVLDAITFALHGSCQGPEVTGQVALRLRPGGDARGHLQFTVSGRAFKITRVPEHRRPKKRGEGWTIEKSSVLLYGSDGDSWNLISANAEEVGARINQEIGLTGEQFGQVVLLPQGDFARFLRADDDKRREVLTKLFGAGRFDRMTAEFERRAQAARASEELAKAAVHDALTRAKEAGDLPSKTSSLDP
jgi:hypothetical protein